MAAAVSDFIGKKINNCSAVCSAAFPVFPADGSAADSVAAEPAVAVDSVDGYSALPLSNSPSILIFGRKISPVFKYVRKEFKNAFHFLGKLHQKTVFKTDKTPNFKF